MRDLLIKWLHEGIALDTGEELYIPCDNKVSQGDFYSLLRKELGIMRQINTEDASKLRIYTSYKDMKFWVVIKKIAVTPLVAFKKDNEGRVSRVQITNSKDKERIDRLKREVQYAKEVA